MPSVTLDQLQRAVADVVDSRRAVEAKERALVAGLDEVLRRLGYAVVPVRPPSAEPGRAPRGRARR